MLRQNLPPSGDLISPFEPFGRQIKIYTAYHLNHGDITTLLLLFFFRQQHLELTSHSCLFLTSLSS